MYFWDLYFVPNVTKATKDNDNGGVHTNSSLLNIISCRLSEYDSRDELTDRLGSLDMENIIEAGSGAKKELQGPLW